MNWVTFNCNVPSSYGNEESSTVKVKLEEAAISLRTMLLLFTNASSLESSW